VRADESGPPRPGPCPGGGPVINDLQPVTSYISLCLLSEGSYLIALRVAPNQGWFLFFRDLNLQNLRLGHPIFLRQKSNTGSKARSQRRAHYGFRETEEQTMLRQMVRKFAQNEVKPASVEYDKKLDPRTVFLGAPQEGIKAWVEDPCHTDRIRWRGVKDIISHIIVMEELGAGDNGFASGLRSVIGLTAWMDVLCSKEQKEEFFQRSLRMTPSYWPMA